MDRKQAFEFIKLHKDLIEESNFKELYEQFDNITDYLTDTHYLTDIFIEAGIDPLKYMDDIPTGYHFESTLPKTYSIGNIDTIGSYAFAYMTGLDTLDISSVRYIGEFAFYSDRYLSDIYYNGTKEAIIKVWPEAMDGLGLNYTIHCTDGDIEK